MTYLSLAAGYVTAGCVLFAFAARDTEAWPPSSTEPGLPLWVTTAIVLAVVAIGQLQPRGMLIPSTGSWRVARQIANQAIIFAPVFAVAAFYMTRRRDAVRRVAMLPPTRIGTRLGVGVIAAAAALVAHQAVAGRITALGETAGLMTRPQYLQHLVQILGEDIGIAMLVGSLLRHVRPRTAIIATGALFALGHVPTMLVTGMRPEQVLTLAGDALLSSGGVAILIRMRDIWPLWPVHVVMDLTQFVHARA